MDPMQQLRELQEELSELNSLVQHRGFKRLLKIGEEQVKARQESILLVPLKSMKDVLPQEYAKGEISGIKLFMELTKIEIGSLEAEIQQILETHNVQETSNSTGT